MVQVARVHFTLATMIQSSAWRLIIFVAASNILMMSRAARVGP